jgi:hypothetical protein
MVHREVGFQKRVDRFGPGIRFLTVSGSKQPDLQVILTPWSPDLIVKNPTAVPNTDYCQATYHELRDRGVVFTEAPQGKPFDLQTVIGDLGNSYAILELGASHG